MEKYISPDREAHSLAVQIWRHKLMHTSRPRALKDPATGKTLFWLLQWFEPHLPWEQHYTFSDTSDMRILNLGAIYLIEDLERAAQAYFVDLQHSSQLQANAEAVEAELTSYQARTV